MQRMKLFSDGMGWVRIRYVDPDGEPRDREFFVPSSGGYVREWRYNGNHRQVCDGLGNRGSTLVSTPDTLADDIRREYRAMRRAQKAYV